MNDPIAKAAFNAAASIYGTTPEKVAVATKHKGAGDARKTALAILTEYGYTYQQASEATGSNTRSIGRAVSRHHELCTIDAKYREAWQQARERLQAQAGRYGEGG